MIAVYTKNGCSFCDDIKEWLNAENIEFTEKPIEDRNYLIELKEKEVAAVPHTVLNKENEVTGFDNNVKEMILKNQT